MLRVLAALRYRGQDAHLRTAEARRDPHLDEQVEDTEVPELVRYMRGVL
jgi:hypothetical protein